MPLLLPTVCQYITENRKKDSFWINFNTVYNDIHAFKQKEKYKDNFRGKYLNKDYTDENKKKEFLEFMKENFPDVKLIPVFDVVDMVYLKYPYLGSVLIDSDIDSDVYKAICAKFENPDGMPKDNRLVIWAMKYADAKKRYENLKKEWENF